MYKALGIVTTVTLLSASVVEVTHAAQSFVKLGLQPHSSVAVIGFNSPRWFIAYLGAIMVGSFMSVLFDINQLIFGFVWVAQGWGYWC